MSNPITGAYIESQDKKANPLQEDTSQKMGLEALMSVPKAFVTAAFDSAIQTPVNGLMQLSNSKEAHCLNLVEPKKAEMGSGEWFAQLGGSAVGSLGNYWLLSHGLKGLGEMIKFKGASSASKVFRPIANIIDKGEKNKVLSNPFFMASTTGAFYGGVLTPVNPNGEDMTQARLKNAAIGSLSVMALIAPNRIRLNNNAIADGVGSKAHEFLTNTTGGMLAGMVTIGARSLADGKAMNFRDASETFVAYSMLGAGYGAYRGFAHSEKPLELKQEEATDRLLAVRRHLAKPKRSTENVEKPNREQWNSAVKQMDRNILNDIRESQLPLDTQLSLARLHRTEFSRMLSNPANNRVAEPFVEHEQNMWKLIESAVKERNAAAAKRIEQSPTKQALNYWTKKPSEGDSGQSKNLPARLDDLNQSIEKTPARPDQQASDQLPAANLPTHEVPAITIDNCSPTSQARDLVPQGATDLRTGFLGNRIRTMNMEMSNADSRVAKRANMHTDGLAQSLVEGRMGKTKLTTSTFVKFGHTPEQANRQAIVNSTTPTSKDAASGIANAEELNKLKPVPWHNQQGEPPTLGI